MWQFHARTLATPPKPNVPVSLKAVIDVQGAVALLPHRSRKKMATEIACIVPDDTRSGHPASVAVAAHQQQSCFFSCNLRDD
jgi:hypothetical protein